MNKKLQLLKLIFLTFIFSMAIIYPNICLAVEGVPEIKNPFDNIQIAIPGMNRFTDATDVDASGNFKSTWIAEYIVGIYKYAIGIIGIIAMMAIAIGGAMWVISAGNPGRISEAKSWITSGILGLALGLGSYLILAIINVDLVVFKPLNMTYIDDPDIEGDSDPDQGGSSGGGTGGGGGPWTQNYKTTLDRLRSLGIYCPREDENLVNATISQKMAKIPQIAQSFNGKMVYRWGSKNGVGSDKSGPTPDGKVGYDCSGYTRQVLWCAGFNIDPGLSTNSMFPAEKITSCSGDTINGKKLEPGDLVGWPNTNMNRHVLIYIGNGILTDSHGGKKGRTVSSYGYIGLCDAYNKYKKQNLQIKRVRDYQK